MPRVGLAQPCSDLMKAMSAERLRAIFDAYDIGAKVTLKWRDVGESEWSVWNGEYVATHRRSEEEYYVVVWNLEDRSECGLLPSDTVEVADLVLHQDGTNTRQRGVAYSERFRTTAHLERTISSTQSHLTQSSVADLMQRFEKMQKDYDDVRDRVRRLEASAEADKPKRPRSEAPEMNEVDPIEASLMPRPASQSFRQSEPPVCQIGEGLSCGGCASFGCVLFADKEDRLTFLGQIDDEKMLLPWLLAHGLVLASRCSNKPGCGPMSPTLTRCGVSWICRNKKCRTTKKQNGLGGRWNNLIRFIIQYMANKANLANAHQNMMECTRETCRSWEIALGEAATLFSADCVEARETDDFLAWDMFEWDETFHAARTFQKGSRVRNSGALTFHGGVHTVKAGDGRRRVIDAIIASASSKSRADVVPLLQAVASPAAAVSTDGAAMYRGLKDCGFTHASVNHSREFVTKLGEHTNSVEGFWNLVKSTAKRYWSRQPAADGDTALNFQLVSFVVNCEIKDLHVASALLVLLRWRVALTQATEDMRRWTVLVEAAKRMLASHAPESTEIGDRDAPVNSPSRPSSNRTDTSSPAPAAPEETSPPQPEPDEPLVLAQCPPPPTPLDPALTIPIFPSRVGLP